MAIQTWLCAACGVECSRIRVRGQVPKWCSECRAKCCRWPLRNCLRCSHPFRPTYEPQVYCGNACYGEAQRKPKPAPKPVRERITWPTCWIQVTTCRSCGELFTSRFTASTCSIECARKKHRADNHKYGSDQRHRRRSQTTETSDGPIDWRRVCTRDGLACYLCGYDTDVNDYTMAPGSDGREAFIVGLEYPSLDHVIPLSKGGAHSMSNARLAHTYCNSIKSDQVA